MAVDLPIQLFSYELFNYLWAGFQVKCQPYSASTIPEDVFVESHFNKDIADAVICRQVLFRNVYVMQFQYTGILYCDSPSDFLAHMCVAFADKPFRELKVFDRIIATAAFVIEMGFFCLSNGNTNFTNDAFLCWAMYFDTELKSTFYDQGGWKVLKSVAKSYQLPFLALKTLSKTPCYIEVPLHKFAAGLEDYYDFQRFQDPAENQTCTSSWIQFRLKSRQNTGPKFEFRSVEGLEQFLTSFKFLCDPLGERILNEDVRNVNFQEKFKGNEYLEKLAMKLSNCSISCNSKLNNNEDDGLYISQTPEVFQRFPESAEQALAMQIKTMENKFIIKDDASSEQHIENQIKNEETNNLSETVANLNPVVMQVDGIETDNLRTYISPLLRENWNDTPNDPYKFILKMYDIIRISLKVDDVRKALDHVSVFMGDHHKSQMVLKSAPVKSKCDIKQMSRTSSSEERELTNRTQNKKKRKNKSRSCAFEDDTKDILRMALVLGCQPGVNYVKSTLKEAFYKTTSV